MALGIDPSLESGVHGYTLFVYVYSLHTGSSIGDPLQSDFFLNAQMGVGKSSRKCSEVFLVQWCLDQAIGTSSTQNNENLTKHLIFRFDEVC